jgi:Zn-dependent protease with chaperone function
VFTAVLRHELAHVRNRDAAVHRIATALRNAYLVGAVFTAVAVGRWEPVLLARLAAMSALIELLRRAVLRAREHRADLRASTDGDNDLLMTLLPVAPRPRRWRWIHRLLESLAWHPCDMRRRAVLIDAGALPGFPVPAALTAGLLAGAAITTALALLALGRGGPVPADALSLSVTAYQAEGPAAVARRIEDVDGLLYVAQIPPCLVD